MNGLLALVVIAAAGRGAAGAGGIGMFGLYLAGTVLICAVAIGVARRRRRK